MNFSDECDGAIDALASMRMRGTCDIANENPLAVDALRGTMWEDKWRGTLTEYLTQVNVHDLATKTINRLRAHSVANWNLTGEHVSLGRMGLGTFGWKYDPEVIREAVGLGINLIDTAESYGYGKVEKHLGDALEGLDTSFLTIATKVARNHMSYKATYNAGLRSFAALGETIDLLQLHWPVMTKLPETVTALGELVDNEVIYSIGVSNFSIDQIECIQSLLEPYDRVRSVQVRYNLVDRGIERALLPYCQEHGVEVIAYSPLGQGFGNILKRDASHALRGVAKVYGATEAQVALAWVASHDGVIPIPRTNNTQHVKEIVAAKGLHLSKDTINRLDEAFPRQE